MAVYTILFGLSIFMIALVIAIIKKMFFEWKEEHKIENMQITTGVDRPAVSVIINLEKSLLRRRCYQDHIEVYDVLSKSDISVTKQKLDDLE